MRIVPLLRAALAALAASVALAPAAARADCGGEPAGDPRFLTGPARCVPRPSAAPGVRLGVEVMLGWLDARGPTDHAASGVALPIDLELTRAFSIGARLAYVRAAGTGTDETGATVEQGDVRALTLGAGPRLVLMTEPARREAWRLEADGGLVRLGRDVGGLVEVGIVRQMGWLLAEDFAARGTGHAFALSLRYQQGLGDADRYRALLLGLSYALELLARLPEGPAPPRRRPVVEHRIGGGAVAGAAGKRGEEEGGLAGGVGLWIGLPFGRVFELHARTEALHLARSRGDSVLLYTVMGGLHLGRWFPFFGELLAGWSVALAAAPGASDGAFVEVRIGAQLPNMLGCGFGIRGGPAMRFGVSPDSRGVFITTAAIELTYDSLIRARECWP